MEVQHFFLVKSDDLESGWKKVKAFLKGYELIHYDDIKLLKNDSISSQNPEFNELLSRLLRKNKSFLQKSLDELKDEGYCTTDDLKELPQGYLSKFLHGIVHFLDGFYGVDSYFYNLEEGSHWVSMPLLRKIKKGEKFWLLKVLAKNLLPDEQKKA